jgi:hypothetical protein
MIDEGDCGATGGILGPSKQSNHFCLKHETEHSATFAKISGPIVCPLHAKTQMMTRRTVKPKQKDKLLGKSGGRARVQWLLNSLNKLYQNVKISLSNIFYLSSGIYHFLTSKQISKKQAKKKLGGNHENKIHRPKNGCYFMICELSVLLFKRGDVILHLTCFFCCSFYVAVSISEFIAKTGRIISE